MTLTPNHPNGGPPGVSVNIILSQPSSNKKKVSGRGVPYEHQRKVGFHEVDMSARSDETPTDFNCWIIERNYTPKEHKEPPKSYQANVTNQNAAYDSVTDSQQTNSSLQQDSNESNETEPSKATKGSDDTWALTDNTTGLSPQEKALVEELALEEPNLGGTTDSNQFQQESPQVQPPPAKEGTPDSQLSRHSTTLHDLHKEPDKETEIQEEPFDKIAIGKGVEWFKSMRKDARTYAWSLILPEMLEGWIYQDQQAQV